MSHPKPPPRTGTAIPVVNDTHYRVATRNWQFRPPQDALVVIVKGTFAIVPGEVAVPADSKFPSGDDFALYKPNVDVLLRGHAHAPGGSAKVAHVRLTCGGVDKRIVVLGDRQWRRTHSGWTPTQPEPFQSVPLAYERAFGGPQDPNNPIGVGRVCGRLPNLELPHEPIRSPSQAVEPACFLPIDMEWERRWSKLGRYSRSWLDEGWPYFPEDFDWGFFQCAPPDQQTEEMSGDEAFELSGVHADHGVFRGRLPGKRPRLFACKRARPLSQLTPIELRLDTVTFDADEMTVDLVWRGAMPVIADDAPEIHLLYVADERLDSDPLTAEEASAGFVAAITPVDEELAEQEADNDVTREIARGSDPALDDTASALERMIQERLAEEDLSDFDEPTHLAESVEPETVARMLSEVGANPDEVAEFVKALGPDEIVEVETREIPPPIRAVVMAMLAEKSSFANFDFAGADLSDLDFSGAELAGADLRAAKFNNCTFDDTNLAGALASDAEMRASSFARADLTGADFARAKLDGASFEGAVLSRAEFSHAIGTRTVFVAAKGDRVMFDDGDWADARFDRVEIKRADFSRADLARASFAEAQIPEFTLYDAKAHAACFDGARMANARAEGAVLTQCSFVGVIADGSVFENAQLDEADLRQSRLRGSSFLRAVCRKTQFDHADLSETRFDRADLKGSSFRRANLIYASMEAVDLTIADLRDSNLHSAGLWKAKLTDAKLGGAITSKSTLAARPT